MPILLPYSVFRLRSRLTHCSVVTARFSSTEWIRWDMARHIVVAQLHVHTVTLIIDQGVGVKLTGAVNLISPCIRNAELGRHNYEFHHRARGYRFRG